MKIWVIAIILFLSGCANTTWQELSTCRQLNPEEGACSVEYAAYEKHQDAIARREAKRIANQCPKGMGRLSDGHDAGGCVSQYTLKKILRGNGVGF